MNVKRVHEWDEPWKKKEKNRLNEKKRVSQNLYDQQRELMEVSSTQHVRFTCHKELLLPGLYRNFTVKVKIPLRYEEIKERVKAAFPELHWEES